MQELSEIVDDLEIKYKFKEQKYDFNHLVVIFSGYGERSEFTYNMENVLQHCPANVLWIKDDFYGRASYYICHERNLHISKCINKFIECKLQILGIKKECCTLAGFSKGGTAALYFGLTFGYRNILMSAPQFKLGTFCQRYRPDTLKHLAGNDIGQVEWLNNLIDNTIEDCKNYNKNIYLFISPSDPDYLEQEIYSKLLSKFSNFSLIVSKSKFIRNHAMVTMHSVPLILSVLYALSSGAEPRFGQIELAPTVSRSKVVKEEVIVDLRKAALEGDIFFPEGVGIIRGHECNTYGDIDYQLVFKDSSGERYSYKLAKSHRPILTREFYSKSFCVYDKCWFCTPSFSGISINNLPVGTYELFMILRVSGGGQVEKKISSTNIIDNVSLSDRYKYNIHSDSSGVLFIKSDIK